MASRCAWILTVMTTLALGSVARADGPSDDKAKATELGDRALALASEGFKSKDRSKLEEAIVLYKQAFELEPNPLYQCNAGVAYQVIDELPRAHALLTQCLLRLPAIQASAVPRFRTKLDAVEAALPERHVAVDVITAPAGATLSVSTFAADEHLVAPTVVWLPVGTHSIAATAGGYDRATEEVSIAAVDITTHAKKRVRLSLSATVVPTVTVADPIVVTKPAPGRSNKRRTAAKVSLGLGLSFGAAGGVMHAVAYWGTKKKIGNETTPDEQYLSDRLKTQSTIAYSLYGVGGAALITGAVLFYLSPKHGDRIAITPAPAGEGAMVWLDLSP